MFRYIYASKFRYIAWKYRVCQKVECLDVNVEFSIIMLNALCPMASHCFCVLMLNERFL